MDIKDGYYLYTVVYRVDADISPRIASSLIFPNEEEAEKARDNFGPGYEVHKLRFTLKCGK